MLENFQLIVQREQVNTKSLTPCVIPVPFLLPVMTMPG